MSDYLDWAVDGRDWPHREASRFVRTPGIHWHVQSMGSGPVALLLHGTGASVHSWRGVMPLLSDRFRVIAPDLPGHAFTRGRPRDGLSLPGMAHAVGDLLSTLDIRPAVVVGHSAGAAIALQMAATDQTGAPIVGLSAALLPFEGIGANAFPFLAKLLFLNPLVPRLFAMQASSRGETERFLFKATGSRIDGTGLRCYEILLGNSRHTSGVLEMMANWNLGLLERRLGTIKNPTLLLHGECDKAVNLESAKSAARKLGASQFMACPNLGHLAHEEAPELTSSAIKKFLDGI